MKRFLLQFCWNINANADEGIVEYLAHHRDFLFVLSFTLFASFFANVEEVLKLCWERLESCDSPTGNLRQVSFLRKHRMQFSFLAVFKFLSFGSVDVQRSSYCVQHGKVMNYSKQTQKKTQQQILLPLNTCVSLMNNLIHFPFKISGLFHACFRKRKLIKNSPGFRPKIALEIVQTRELLNDG